MASIGPIGADAGFEDGPGTPEYRLDSVDSGLHQRRPLLAHLRIEVLSLTRALDHHRRDHLSAVRNVQHEHKISRRLRVAGFVGGNPAYLVKSLGIGIDHAGRDAPPMLIDVMGIDLLRSVYRHAQVSLPDAGTVVGVHSAYYIRHGGKHHHVVCAEIGFHIRQHERLRFHAARVPDQRNDGSPENSLGLNGCLRQLGLVRVPPAT
jgi:hypothetical protein